MGDTDSYLEGGACPLPYHIYEARDGWPAMRPERDLSLEPRLRYIGAFDMPAALDVVEQMTDAAMAKREAIEE